MVCPEKSMRIRIEERELFTVRELPSFRDQTVNDNMGRNGSVMDTFLRSFGMAPMRRDGEGTDVRDSA